MRKIVTAIAVISLVFGGIFLASPAVSHAQQQNYFDGTNQSAIEKSFNGVCMLFSGDFGKCMLWLVYQIWLGISFWVAQICGKLFDFFIYYTLNTEAYKADFITKGWGLIRDISNVAFIFTLLYLAIRHILGMSAKKYIPTLIVVALLLNFSLFFTKVVIDAGNILARAFVNSINIENDSYADQVGYRSISVGILDKINPQRLLSQTLFKPKFNAVQGSVDSETGEIIAGSEYPILDDNLTYYFFVFILLGVVNFTLAWTFLSVGLLFLGRIVGLWFAMIFSPIAFITLAVPGSSGFLKGMSFDSWKDTLLKLAFVAPVFLFFLYLMIMFLQVIFTTPIPTQDGDTAMIILSIFIPFAFVIFILNHSKKVATEMAGEFGGMAKSIIGKALGVVGGAALGVGGFAARATIGRAASVALKDGKYNERIKNATGINRWRLMQERTALKKINESSLDIRNAGKAKGVAGWASRQVGAGLGAGMTGFGGDKFNVGKASDQSRKKYEEGKEKKKLELAKDLEKIDRNEDLSIVSRMLNKDGFDAQNNMLNQIDNTLRNLENPAWVTRVFGPLTPEQRQAKIANYQGLRSAIELSESKDDLEKAIKEGKTRTGPGDNDFVITHDGIKAEMKTRRNDFADVTENDPFYQFTTGFRQAEVTADKIRTPEKSKEKQILDILQPPGTTPPPATPTPPTPPAGGGGTPPPPATP